MFRGMEYVYEVWQARSFSAAAKKLYISQPALSNSIKRVEEKVGTPIFDRSTSPIQLTEVGREYIHAVEQIHSIQENFSRYLADTQELRTGNITVGSGAMMTAYLLPGIIAAYKEKYPYVEVKVTEGSCAQLRNMLAEGTLDVVLENTQMPAALFESQPYGRDYMVLAVPRSWPINAQLRAWQLSIENICSGNFLRPRYPAVPLENFAESPFLLMSQDDENYRRAVSLCEKKRLYAAQHLNPYPAAYRVSYGVRRNGCGLYQRHTGALHPAKPGRGVLQAGGGRGRAGGLLLL